MDRDTSRARSQTQTDSTYQTPDWLERSFVLPTQRRREHDDLAALARRPVTAPSTRMTSAMLVRPTSPTIDYPRLLRRNQTARAARRTAVTGLALTALAAGASVVTSSTTTATLLRLAASMTLASAGTAAALGRAPVPRLRG
ncbi:MAG: hypothetical protein ABIN79_07195 [Marmoricola sp.]